MGLIEELRDLDLVADDVISKVRYMTELDLHEQKRLWEERICNDSIDSALQEPRLRVLRSVNEEIDSRK